MVLLPASDAMTEDVVLPLHMDAKLLKSLKKDLAMVPCNQNSLSRSIAALRRIDRIEIPNASKYHGSKFYHVHIFYKTRQSNIPTTRTVKATKASKKASPDVVVTQRFSGFSSIRQEMYYHALVGHIDDPWTCSLCSNMVKLLEHGRAQPRLRLKLFQRESSVCAVLEEFLNAVVQLVADTAPSNRNRCGCQGQDVIPVLLYRFLFGQDEENQQNRPSGRNCRPRRL